MMNLVSKNECNLDGEKPRALHTKFLIDPSVQYENVVPDSEEVLDRIFDLLFDEVIK